MFCENDLDMIYNLATIFAKRRLVTSTVFDFELVEVTNKNQLEIRSYQLDIEVTNWMSNLSTTWQSNQLDSEVTN